MQQISKPAFLQLSIHAACLRCRPITSSGSSSRERIRSILKCRRIWLRVDEFEAFELFIVGSDHLQTAGRRESETVAREYRVEILSSPRVRLKQIPVPHGARAAISPPQKAASQTVIGAQARGHPFRSFEPAIPASILTHHHYPELVPFTHGPCPPQAAHSITLA